MKEVLIKVNGQELVYYPEVAKAQAEYIAKKEKEYWEYCLSGQRTLDLFGEEGAKRVLEEQRKREEND
jgi:hypothetical protein